MPREPFRDPSEPLFERRMNELEEGKVNKESITGEQIAPNTITGGKLAKAVPGRILAHQVSGFVSEKLPAGNIIVLKPNGVLPSAAYVAAAKVITLTEEPACIFTPVLAEYEIAGKTLSWELEATIATNAVAIGTNLTFSLQTITAVAGAEKKVAITTSTSAGFFAFTTPAAEKVLTGKKAAMTLVNGTGYVMNVEPLAETAAKSGFLYTCSLYAKNE